MARRQCLIDQPGIAFWQNPDFSNCISERFDKIIRDVSLIFNLNYFFLKYLNILLCLPLGKSKCTDNKNPNLTSITHFLNFVTKLRFLVSFTDKRGC